MSNSQISRHNNTSVALDDTQTFSGIGEITLLFQGVYTNCESDQDCERTLSWSNDNVNYIFTNVVAITGGTPFSRSFANKGLYYKLKIENNSGANMTRLTALSRYINDVMDSPDGIEVKTFPSVAVTLWDNETIAAGDESAVVDLNHVKHVDLMGNANGICSLIFQLSHNNADWYDSGMRIVINPLGEFHVTAGALASRYLRMKTDANVTITCHVSGKG
jgi:hypothetical protein